MEGQLDSTSNQEEELIFPLDDETYRQHQTCNPQSSCRTGTQVGQVFQEIHYPSAMHTDPQGRIQIDKGMPLEIQHLFHSGEKCHNIELSLAIAVGSLGMKQTPIVPA